MDGSREQTEEQRAQEFREFQASHLERQTKAVEEMVRHTYTLRLLAIAWTIASAVLFLLALSGAFAQSRF